MKKEKLTFIKDQFRKNRGSRSQILEITCRDCGHFVAYYQKDGPGHLRRMYVDRIRFPATFATALKQKIKKIKPLQCKKCKETLGIPIIYIKENRKAFRLFVDAVKKKVVSLKILSRKGEN